MAMFDPSKLDIDFSDTSDLNNIEKEKIQSGTQEVAKKQNTTLQKDTINLEKNAIAENAKYDNDSVDVDMRLNPKQDTAKLATIITDSDLVEKDKEVKEFNEQKAQAELNPENRNILIDINLTKLDDFMSILLREKYDYFRVEPQEDEVKVTFVKDTVDKEIKFIKYPTYSRVLLEMKKAGKLKLDIVDDEQKGKGKYDFLDKQYTTLVKTKPNALGESVYFKVEESVKTAAAKKKEKMSISKILWFLVALLMASLIIGGMFLGFILFNSNSIGDLKFFNDLGIDIDKIRQFVAMLVNIIFFTIVFILTAFSITYIFKAILTKKEFKKKKTTSAVLALSLLIITFITGFLWLNLSKKVAELKSANYGQPVVYDNTKLLSSFYDSPRDALLQSSDLIGPITLKFDISEFLNKLSDDGNTITKITWIFDGKEIEKPGDNTEYIKEYTQAGSKTVDIMVDIVNLEGTEEQIKENVANYDVQYIVEVNEKVQGSGGRVYSFDASSLSQEGSIEWYYIPDVEKSDEVERAEIIQKALSEPIIKGPDFSPQEVLFEKEIIVGMLIKRKGEVSSDLDKIFIVGGVGESDIVGEINSSPSLKGDLSYEFWLSDLENSFGNGFIDTVTWQIGEQEIEKSIDINDTEKSSKIEYTFKEYGENKIIATLIDSNGNKKIIESLVKINKSLTLKNGLDIFNGDSNETIGRYNDKIFEYDVNSLPIPAKLRFDTRYVSATNQLYALKKVDWDFDADGNYDEEGKQTEHLIEAAGDYKIIVKYTFEHRTVRGEIIEIEENIFIDAEKKDVILDLQIEKESNYVPLVIRFDASRSQVAGEDIEKFTYDYGDGTPPEERDAINPGHKYLEAGRYTIKLTVTTKNGKEFSTTKDLNLLDRPQEIVISTSLKKTNTFQDINFSSEKSNGQINSYYWDFGDGKYSTIANPVKSFQEPGTYKVILRGTFANNNVEEDEVTIIIE